MMRDVLTEDQKYHIEMIFHRYEEQMNKQYDENIKPELEVLALYKGDLAKAYKEVAGQRNSLIGCMKEIIDNQEALVWIMRDLIKVITGKYPKARDRIDAVEEENPWK
tara:strand:- start:30635 stop:30958 length:324 start_codon:yes stop_codon:yes gene_type:complete